MKRESLNRCLVLVAWVLLLAGTRGALADTAVPANHVVIIVDSSGSFRSRVSDALEQVRGLLDGLATRKVHRWEPATDRIWIVSLDALPGVLWHGTVADLKTLDEAAWLARFEGRSDFSHCTDVTAAFRLAARVLGEESRFVAKYIWAFSDLIDEPPTETIRTCRAPRLPSLPNDEFPWEQLRGVAVSVFWMPPNQVLAWRRAAEERGLADSSLAFYTTSESSSVVIQPPQRHQVEHTKAELAAEREALLWGFAKLGGGAVVVTIGCALVLLFVARAPRGGRGRRAARDARRTV